LLTARLLGAPGVPRLVVTVIRPVASIQLPCTRMTNSGQPRSQRTLARIVAVSNIPRGLVSRPQMRLAPVSPRELARIWSDWLLLYPLVVSSVERTWLPCGVQPVSPLSKVGLVTRLVPAGALNTSTLSSRHSPSPSRTTCRLSGG